MVAVAVPVVVVVAVTEVYLIPVAVVEGEVVDLPLSVLMLYRVLLFPIALAQAVVAAVMARMVRAEETVQPATTVVLPVLPWVVVQSILWPAVVRGARVVPAQMVVQVVAVRVVLPVEV